MFQGNGTTSNSSPSPNASSPTSSRHIAKGKIVGIVLGCVVAASLLTASLVVLRRRSKRRFNEAIDHSAGPRPVDNGEVKDSHGLSEILSTERPRELADPRPWLEMPALEQPLEMGIYDKE